MRIWNESWGVYCQELKGVDNATFVVRADGLGSDKNGIFHRGSGIPTSPYYATDKANVWYRGLLISRARTFPKKTLRAVDRRTFADLQKGQAKDKHGRISFGNPVD